MFVWNILRLTLFKASQCFLGGFCSAPEYDYCVHTCTKQTAPSGNVFCQRIAGITSMLQQSLEGLLIEGLQTSNVDMVRHCLRTYATVDKTRDAEALVGQVLVKPYMDQVNMTHILQHFGELCFRYCYLTWMGALLVYNKYGRENSDFLKRQISMKYWKRDTKFI